MCKLFSLRSLFESQGIKNAASLYCLKHGTLGGRGEGRRGGRQCRLSTLSPGMDLCRFLRSGHSVAFCLLCSTSLQGPRTHGGSIYADVLGAAVLWDKDKDQGSG